MTVSRYYVRWSYANVTRSREAERLLKFKRSVLIPSAKMFGPHRDKPI